MTTTTPKFARIGMIFSAQYFNSGIVNYIPEMYSIPSSKLINNETQNLNQNMYNLNDPNEKPLSRDTQQKVFKPKSFWNSCFR